MAKGGARNVTKSRGTGIRGARPVQALSGRSSEFAFRPKSISAPMLREGPWIRSCSCSRFLVISRSRFICTLYAASTCFRTGASRLTVSETEAAISRSRVFRPGVLDRCLSYVSGKRANYDVGTLSDFAGFSLRRAVRKRGTGLRFRGPRSSDRRRTDPSIFSA